MDESSRDRSMEETGERQLGSLEGKVIGAVQPTAVSVIPVTAAMPPSDVNVTPVANRPSLRGFAVTTTSPGGM